MGFIFIEDACCFVSQSYCILDNPVNTFPEDTGFCPHSSLFILSNSSEFRRPHSTVLPGYQFHCYKQHLSVLLRHSWPSGKRLSFFLSMSHLLCFQSYSPMRMEPFPASFRGYPNSVIDPYSSSGVGILESRSSTSGEIILVTIQIPANTSPDR